MLDNKVIVVTGALGVLGSSVAAAAEQAGARVARLDQATTGNAGDLIFQGLDLRPWPTSSPRPARSTGW
jgi:nucleoside-diphosphate-sugar epimerase